MKYEDIVQMAVTMTEMDTGVSLNTVEKQEMIDRMLKLGFNSYILFMGSNNALQMIYFTR